LRREQILVLRIEIGEGGVPSMGAAPKRGAASSEVEPGRPIWPFTSS
jgi:hypothetical protein